MSYKEPRSYVHDIALIRGIDLLVNMIEQLKVGMESLQNVFGEWQESSTLGYENQVKIIFGASADNKASLYLVNCLSKLNKHKMHEFPHREYMITLTIDCLDAILRAARAHDHIWNKAQLHTVMSALGSAQVVKGKALAYIDYEDDEDKKKEQKKHIIGKNNGRD